MTLHEMTGKEFGIIVYDEQAKSVAAVNWASTGEDMLPMLSPIGEAMIDFPQEEGWAEIKKEEQVPDFRMVLPGSVWLADEKDKDGSFIADTDLDIIYDGCYDLLRAFLDDKYCEEDMAGDMSASVYYLACGVIIIAPHKWN